MARRTPSWKRGFARRKSQSAAPGLWKGLVGHWAPSLGPTGVTLFDVSHVPGQGDNGILASFADINGAYVPGNPRSGGHAVVFDGASDYVDIAQSTINVLGEMSCFAWVNIATIPTVGLGDAIIGQAVAAGLVGQFMLAIIETTNEVQVVWNGAVSHCVTTGFSLVADQWYHVGFVRTGSAGDWTCRIYVDGIERGTASSIATDPGTPELLSIGRPGDFDGVYLDGRLSSVSVWSRPVVLNEIQTLFTRPNAILSLRRLVLPTAVAKTPWHLLVGAA